MKKLILIIGLFFLYSCNELHVIKPIVSKIERSKKYPCTCAYTLQSDENGEDIYFYDDCDKYKIGDVLK